MCSAACDFTALNLARDWFSLEKRTKAIPAVKVAASNRQFSVPQISLTPLGREQQNLAKINQNFNQINRSGAQTVQTSNYGVTLARRGP
jgi:hypothetical protein